MKPDDKPAVLPPYGDALLQSGEALLDVGSWCEEKAKAPLRLSFEVDGRAAACLRLSASVSGLSVQEVARRCIESFHAASKNIATFTEMLFNHVHRNPSGAEVDAVTAKILLEASKLMNAAGEKSTEKR